MNMEQRNNLREQSMVDNPTKERRRTYPEEYRQEEISWVLETIRKRQSGVMIGGPNSGKSNIARILGAMYDYILKKLPVENHYLFCLVDCNKFPMKSSIATSRVLLRELYNRVRTVDPSIAKELRQYVEVSTTLRDDDIACYYALEDAIRFLIDELDYQIIFVLDRFDKFCASASSGALDMLRSLRDNDLFYGKLLYFPFTRKPLHKLRSWEEGTELLDILQVNTCWIGPMCNRDARWIVRDMATREQREIHPMASEIIVAETGGLPALTKIASQVWLKIETETGQALRMSPEEFRRALMAERAISEACGEIMADLDPMQRDVLVKVAMNAPQLRLDERALATLENYGFLVKREKWEPFCPLLQEYLAHFADAKPGYITMNGDRTVLLDGAEIGVKLTANQGKVMRYMLDHANHVFGEWDLAEALYTEEEIEQRGNPAGAAMAHYYAVKRALDTVNLADRCESVGGHDFRFLQPELPEEFSWLAQHGHH